MNVRPNAGVLPPVQFQTTKQMLFSIDVCLPAELNQELQRYADEDLSLWEKKAEEALVFYRESFMTGDNYAHESILWIVRHLLALPEPPTVLSPKKRRELYERARAEAAQLRADGRLGNLIVPEEVYEFVKSKMESGDFESATAVLVAAIPFLRAERGKPPRAEIVWPPPYPRRKRSVSKRKKPSSIS